MTNFEFIKIMGVKQAISDITQIVLKEIKVHCPYEEMGNMDIADLEDAIEKWLNKKICASGKRAYLVDEKLKLIMGSDDKLFEKWLVFWKEMSLEEYKSLDENDKKLIMEDFLKHFASNY